MRTPTPPSSPREQVSAASQLLSPTTPPPQLRLPEEVNEDNYSEQTEESVSNNIHSNELNSSTEEDASESGKEANLLESEKAADDTEQLNQKQEEEPVAVEEGANNNIQPTLEAAAERDNDSSQQQEEEVAAEEPSVLQRKGKRKEKGSKEAKKSRSRVFDLAHQARKQFRAPFASFRHEVPVTGASPEEDGVSAVQPLTKEDESDPALFFLPSSVSVLPSEPSQKGLDLNTNADDIQSVGKEEFIPFGKDSWRKALTDSGTMAGYWALFNAENVGLSYLVELLNVSSRTNKNVVVPAFLVGAAVQYSLYELITQHFVADKENRVRPKEFMLNVGIPLPIVMATFTQLGRWLLTSCMGDDVENALVVMAAYTLVVLAINLVLAQEEKKKSDNPLVDEETVLLDNPPVLLSKKQVMQKTAVPLTQAWLAVVGLVGWGAFDCLTGYGDVAVDAVMDVTGINRPAANLVMSSTVLLATYTGTKLTGIQRPIAKGLFKAAEVGVTGAEKISSWVCQRLGR